MNRDPTNLRSCGRATERSSELTKTFTLCLLSSVSRYVKHVSTGEAVASHRQLYVNAFNVQALCGLVSQEKLFVQFARNIVNAFRRSVHSLSDRQADFLDESFHVHLFKRAADNDMLPNARETFVQRISCKLHTLSKSAVVRGTKTPEVITVRARKKSIPYR